MKPEKQRLLHGLLDDEGRREATLLAGSRLLRRRRHWRAVRRGCALALIVVVAGVWVSQSSSRRVMLQASAPAARPAPPADGHSLTDEELLNLFPGTPVGLATLPDGRKRLIFPRPGDEERFLTRL